MMVLRRFTHIPQNAYDSAGGGLWVWCGCRADMSIKEMQQLEELYKEQLRLSTEEQAYARPPFSFLQFMPAVG